MYTLRAAVLSTAILSLMACTPDGPAPSGPGVPQVASEGKPLVSENGMLTITPGVIDLCTATDGLVASKVEWDAASTGTNGVQVWLESPGEGKKLWSEEGAVGHSVTGKWLRDGSTVSLVNGETKAELATLRLTAVPCAR